MKIKQKPDVRFPSFDEDWKEYKADSIFYSVSDKNYPELPVLSASQEKGMVFRKDIGIDIQYDKNSTKTYKRVIPGQFVIHLRSFQGGFAFSDIEGITSPAYTVLDFKNKNIHDSFFWKSILTSKNFIKRLETVTYGIRDGRSISFNDFSTLKFKVPNYSEQLEISSFFKTIDNLLFYRQQELEMLKQTKQGFLQKMFPKEGESVPEIRFPGFTGEWKNHTLGETVDSMAYGLNASSKEYDGENKYIRITDIDDSTRKFLKEKITSPNTDLSLAEEYLLNEGDILFSRTGASVGKTYIYDSKDGKVYYAGFLIRARIKDEYIPEFIFQNTLTSRYLKFIKVASQRSGQPGVNAQEYAGFSFMIPSKKEQQEISEFFKKLDEVIALHQQELDALKETKKAFLQKMFV